jgi:hypothetical protein
MKYTKIMSDALQIGLYMGQWTCDQGITSSTQSSETWKKRKKQLQSLFINTLFIPIIFYALPYHTIVIVHAHSSVISALHLFNTDIPEFIHNLFNSSIFNLDCIALNCWFVSNERCRGKYAWPNLWYCPNICLEGLRKPRDRWSWAET